MRGCMRLLPNVLTVVRIVCSGIFIYMLYNVLFNHTSTDCMVLYGLAACIWLTDWADGRLARALQATSSVGAWLDIAADSFFIFPTMVVCNLFDILPVWFTVVTSLDFVGFLLTSRWLRQTSHRKQELIFDKLGRVAAVLFYVIPVVVYAAVHNAILADLLPVVLCLTSITAAVSMFARIHACVNLLLFSRSSPY